MSVHGDTIAVGAPTSSYTQGSVHVFERSGGAWFPQAVLLDPTPVGLWVREFGFSVALEAGVLAVGVRSAFGSEFNSGTVAVYRRSAGTWPLEQLLIPQSLGFKDYLGTCLAIEGNRLVAGAPGQLNDVERGSVYVFEHKNGIWSETARIRSDLATGEDQYGGSVALSGDALIVGAWRTFAAGPFSGAAYAYHLVGSHWHELARLLPGDGGMQSEQYARAVAMHGGHGLVGRPYSSPGGAVQPLRVPFLVGAAGCFCSLGPCSNSDPSAGCVNSTGSGAGLTAWGRTHPDEVTLLLVDGPPQRFASLFQALGGVAPHPFGNGVSCAGGGLRPLNRLPRPIAPDGTLVFGSCAGDPPLSLPGGVVPGSG